MIIVRLFVSSSSKTYVYPIKLRKAKTVYNFGLSECNRVKKPHLKSDVEELQMEDTT